VTVAAGLEGRPPFKILSLSGGGFLGLYSASVLAALEERIGEPIHTRFDLIAGTSVGGIIALGLAAEVNAAVIRDTFRSKGIEIFSRRGAPKGLFAPLWDICRSILGPKYSNAALRKVIISLVGEERRVGELNRPVLIPTVNLTKGGPQVFKTPHHPHFQLDKSLKVVDVALATSAAPTFFPLAEIGSSLYADGGLFANSPDLMAVHEAEHFFKIPREKIQLLSIGTTTSSFSFSHSTSRKLGLIGWARNQRLIQAMLASQQQMVDYMLKHSLGDRYFRIDAFQSAEQQKDLVLDVANEAAQKTLVGLADASSQEAINQKLVLDMFSRRADTTLFIEPRMDLR
jgi:patatin-like phospholipase/acyl hydrolase